MKLKGRIINRGKAEGEALVTKDPISFYGGVDPKTGIITDKDNELNGQSICGKVLVFPFGKGSTVGPYTIYQLAKLGTAPLAMINRECETIVAVGAIISDIPAVDKIDISKIKTGQNVTIDGEKITIE
jgi:predicted aconitase with swiveling domain